MGCAASLELQHENGTSSVYVLGERGITDTHPCVTYGLDSGVGNTFEGMNGNYTITNTQHSSDGSKSSTVMSSDTLILQDCNYAGLIYVWVLWGYCRSSRIWFCGSNALHSTYSYKEMPQRVNTLFRLVWLSNRPTSLSRIPR